MVFILKLSNAIDFYFEFGLKTDSKYSIPHGVRQM